MTFNEVVETVGKAIDAAGVAAMVVGACIAAVAAAARVVRADSAGKADDTYRRFRR